MNIPVTSRRLFFAGAALILLLSLAVTLIAYREVGLRARIAETESELNAAATGLKTAEASLKSAETGLKSAQEYGEMRTHQLSLARDTAVVPPEAFLFNVYAALAPITEESLLQTRENLIRFVWKGLNPHELKPSAITDGPRTGNMALVAPSAPVKTIDVNSSETLSGFTEFAQHGSATCLAIWAQGHEGDPGNAPIMDGAASYMKKQWARGCDVLIVPMPFRTQGNITIDVGKRGRIWIGANHDGMALIESAEFSAFRLFFDPLYATLNWLEDTGHRYKTISMAGVSGGGWMSVVYPAIDDRVTNSVSVAGSFPMYLRYLLTDKSLRDVGDWEQTYAPFYRVADYFELYLLSALGRGRHQTLVYNAEDPCCFSASRALTFLPQLERKAKALNIMLGSIIDNTQQKHDISEFVISELAKANWSDAQASVVNR
jgi:hypothetical protein